MALVSFDHLAPLYDWFMHPLERRQLRQWRQQLWQRLPEKATVLEIGVGTGANFPFYGQRQVYAIDESRKMLERAQRRAPDRVRLVHASVENLPFPDQFFDAAVSTLVFCSVKDPLQALREIKRVVRPGGILLFLEHTRPRGWKGYLLKWLEYLTVPLMNEHFTRDIRQYLQQVQLPIEEVQELTPDGLFILVQARRP